MAQREARSFVLGAVGLVALAAMFVWALAAPAEPDLPVPPDLSAPPAPPAAVEAPEPPPRPPPAPKPAPAAQKAAAEAAPTDPEAVDLFAGPMPEWMHEIHERVLGRGWLHVSAQKQLYQFGQEHTDDARPQLLLAWDSMNREWWGFAVRLYKQAYEADERAKHDPTMLRDLLEIASRFDRVEYRESADLIDRAYGADAIPKLDLKLEELRRAGHLTRAERLAKLRATLK